MLFVGDVHGKFMTYRNLVEGIYERDGGPAPSSKSIQLGDHGVGFHAETDLRQAAWAAANPGHRFIRGNHDCLVKCEKNLGFVRDLTVEEGVFYLGGAWSIDRHYRTVGVDWWEDEELSYSELEDAIEFYTSVKPRVMVTHDCPTGVAWEMFIREQTRPYQVKTRTGEALQEMFESWKPELWLFGHWHSTRTANIDGTDFVCLGELAWCEVDLNAAGVIDGPYSRDPHTGLWS